jgi:hypothetical protein
MSAAARLYWPHQQQTYWHRTPLNGNDTVLGDEDLKPHITKHYSMKTYGGVDV